MGWPFCLVKNVWAEASFLHTFRLPHLHCRSAMTLMINLSQFSPTFGVWYIQLPQHVHNALWLHFDLLFDFCVRLAARLVSPAENHMPFALKNPIYSPINQWPFSQDTLLLSPDLRVASSNCSPRLAMGKTSLFPQTQRTQGLNLVYSLTFSFLPFFILEHGPCVCLRFLLNNLHCSVSCICSCVQNIFLKSETRM